MAIPDKPLKFSFDPDELTVDEWEIFYRLNTHNFREFMLRYGNWTAAEVGGLKKRELSEIAGKFYDALMETISPKVSAPS